MTTTKFPFENVSGASPDLRRYGIASFEIDAGSGKARCTAIVLHAQRPGGADRLLLPGAPKFDEVLAVLITERREDIDAALEAAREVGHAKAFRGELLPAPAYRSGKAPHLPATTSLAA